MASATALPLLRGRRECSHAIFSAPSPCGLSVRVSFSFRVRADVSGGAGPREEGRPEGEDETSRNFKWHSASSRRQTLVGSGAACVAAALQQVMGEEAALAAKDITVGSYLPKSGDGNLVLFSPGDKSTPALRAGNVSPYSFELPPSWTQARIANILSGNYCQPKCAEPWIEVKFEDPKQGLLQVVASPMVRLTNKPNARIEEIGSPETIIAALGPFVTGDSYDPDEVVEINVRQIGDQTYYDYALETPFARSGAHNLAAATAKGSTVLLVVVSATDAQWAAHENTLRKMVKSFRV